MKLINAISKTLLAVAMLAALMLPLQVVTAATTNFGAGYDVNVIALQFPGQHTTTTDPIAVFKMPYAAHLVGVSAACATTGADADETLDVDVEVGGTSVLSATAQVTQPAPATVVEGTVLTNAIADEAVVEILFTIAGTTPTFDDCTVLLTVVRK